MKEFKVAHIVPVAHLEATRDNQYHMCLAHLVDNQAYREFYSTLTSEGKFVLMDNGAAEGSQLDPEALLAMYEEIHPTEIVLPDTLFASGSTVQKSRAFLTLMQNRGVAYRTMAVPQGRTLEEWAACARIFVQDDRINTIGVSKFLNSVTQDKYVRFKACMELEKLFDEYDRHDMEVHLLGCAEGPLVVRMCHEAFPFVRGCDSAFAYLQAQAGRVLQVGADERPAGVIDFLHGRAYGTLPFMMSNFDWLAGVAAENRPDGSWEVQA